MIKRHLQKHDATNLRKTFNDYKAKFLTPFKKFPLAAHVTLQKGKRSELANLANDLL